MTEPKFIVLNGEIMESDKKIFTFTNRSFTYGDGIFETIRWHDDAAINGNLHFQRLHAGMKILGLNFPPDITESFFYECIRQLVSANKISTDARIRLHVFRSGAGLYAPQTSAAEFIISAEPLNEFKFSVNDRGWKAGIFEDHCKHHSPLSAHKSPTHIIYVLASMHAQAKGWDACLILNPQSHIIESETSNVFMMKGSTFITPAVKEGCIDGVMRKLIIELIEKDGGNVLEKSIKPIDLETADEIFLTNSIRGVQWIGAIGPKRYYSKHTRKLIRALNDHLKNKGA
jgi:branched-chain amino acid aminotransferase